MPHIQFTKQDLIKTPSTCEGVLFDFCAKSYNFTQKQRKTEYKIAVKNEGKDFLLTLKEKDDSYLIKG